MTKDETDYAILSAHSKMAAATPPCVQLLAVRFLCTERFLRGHGQKMADVTSTQKMQQTHKRRPSEESLAVWSDDSTIQKMWSNCWHQEQLPIQFQGHTARCRDVNPMNIYKLYIYIYIYIATCTVYITDYLAAYRLTYIVLMHIHTYTHSRTLTGDYSNIQIMCTQQCKLKSTLD